MTLMVSRKIKQVFQSSKSVFSRVPGFSGYSGTALIVLAVLAKPSRKGIIRTAMEFAIASAILEYFSLELLGTD